MYNFQGKYAVVTGAARGIGFATAKRFVEEGIEGVAILDINGESAKESAASLGERAIGVQCNVADADSVHAAFEEVRKAFGRVDILVNNAGITRDAMFHKMNADQFRQVVDVHLFGTVFCTWEVYEEMRNRGYGKIVNISSVSAMGNVGQTNYAAAKSAIEGFTRTLAKEAARKNITVNCILPGMIDTEMLNTIPKDILAARIANLPSQRLGTTDELANMIMFFASDESSYVSGQCIIVSGGAHTR